jgi:large subunit ribosomal protein L4e
MKVNVLSTEGVPIREISLPVIFKEEFRPDLINRAVVSIQSKRRQPYGSDPLAGKRTSAKFVGRRRAYGHTYGWGISRVPRIMIGGRRLGQAQFIPGTVKGRRAHRPLPSKIFAKEINRNERRKAIRSAISATTMRDLVIKRGHKLPDNLKLPIVLEDTFEKFDKTKIVRSTLQKLGLGNELMRAQQKTIRAGKGKLRGRKYKRKKGPLLVILKDQGILKGARNIPGVDICTVTLLNAELLAPGGHPGRLVVWTESAIKELDKKHLFW